MGFSERAQNILSKGIYLAENQNHNFGSWWRTICIPIDPKKKRTLKRIVTDHMKVKFISSGCCSLWSCCCFWTSL